MYMCGTESYNIHVLKVDVILDRLCLMQHTCQEVSSILLYVHYLSHITCLIYPAM